MSKLLCFLFTLTACAAPTKMAWPAVDASHVENSVKTIVKPKMQQQPASAPVKKELSYYRPIDNDTPMLELKSFGRADVEGFTQKLQQLDGKTKEIWVRIDSMGGSVFGGQDLIHTLESASSNIVCVADWKAYSMAFYTLESQGCDFRLMTKRASLMAHEPSTQTEGNAGQLRDEVDFLNALNEGFLQTAATRMQIPVDTLRAKTERRTWWMDYKVAEEWRAIDGWADPKVMPKPTPFEVKKSLIEFLLGG